MARIAFPTADELPEEHRDILQKVERSRGKVSQLFGVLAHSPEVLMARLAYGEALRKKTILNPAFRELAILTVARLNGGGFEFEQHKSRAREAGLSQEQISALADFEDAAIFTAQERAVMRYAAQVTTEVDASDDVWTGLEAFLNKRELVELVLNVAWYNQTARVSHPLKIGE